MFYTILAWSFNWLFRGLWPTHDWNNKEYPSGSMEAIRANTPLVGPADSSDYPFGILWQLKGDLDFHHKDLFGILATSYLDMLVSKIELIHTMCFIICVATTNFNAHVHVFKGEPIQDLKCSGGSHGCGVCPADIHTLPYTDVSDHPCWL